MADPMTKERIAELREIDDCCDDDTLASLAEALDEVERLQAALELVVHLLETKNPINAEIVARWALDGK